MKKPLIVIRLHDGKEFDLGPLKFLPRKGEQLVHHSVLYEVANVRHFDGEKVLLLFVDIILEA